eukprot:895617-Amphidinium_carterae.1
MEAGSKLWLFGLSRTSNAVSPTSTTTSMLCLDKLNVPKPNIISVFDESLDACVTIPGFTPLTVRSSTASGPSMIHSSLEDSLLNCLWTHSFAPSTPTATKLTLP